jgi:hypothetical protein
LRHRHGLETSSSGLHKALAGELNTSESAMHLGLPGLMQDHPGTIALQYASSPALQTMQTLAYDGPVFHLRILINDGSAGFAALGLGQPYQISYTKIDGSLSDRIHRRHY